MKGRAIQYAVAASEFALRDAGLKSDVPLGPDVGVFIASGIGKEEMDQIRKLLDKLDHLDSMLEMVEQQIVDERVANGPDSKGLKKLEKRKDDLVEERDEALEKGAKLDDLQLKPEPKTKR